MGDKLPSIPSIDSRIPKEIQRILSPMKQILDRALSAKSGNGESPFGGVSADEILAALPSDMTDSSTPPAPTGLVVVGGFAVINLEWNKPRYANHAYAEVWRNEADNLGSAVLIGQTPGELFSDAIGNSMAAYYWIRFVSKAGVIGAFNSVSGTLGETSLDPVYVLSVLQDSITESQLHQDLGARIDLVDADAAVVGSVAHRVAQEAAARATAVSQLSTRIDTIVAQAGGDTEEIIAAVSQEQTARADAYNAMSSRIDAVVATANGNTSAITTEQNARASAVSALSTRIDSVVAANASNASAITTEQTTRATADNALSSRIDTLVSTTSANTAAIQNEQTARTNADNALSSTVTTLQTTVGGHTTSIQSLFSTTDGLGAAYTFKVDNNGYVSGYGFASTANTGTPVATFAVRADSFYIANPAGPGIAPSMPFYVQTTPTTINGVEVPVGAYMTDAFIANGSINTAKIGLAAIDTARIADAAITDAKIFSLDAGKISAGYIAAERIAARSLTADKIAGGQIAASEQITVGGAGGNAPLVLNGSGEIISNGPGGNKARFYSGDVEIYKNVPNVGQVVYKALSRIEIGVAANNTRVTVPGYFKTQPKIMVSPRNLTMFKAAYAAQDQTVQCAANTISETSSGSMVWQFTPVATLSLAAASGTTVINQTSGNVSANNWTSSQYTTAANTSSITVSMSIGSSRGNGSSQYFYRTTRWRVEYYNGGWIASAWSTNAIGASTSGAVTSNITVNFPSAGAWAWRVYAECYDTNGSVFGSVSYEYASPQVTRDGPSSIVRGWGTVTGTATLDFTPAAPSGYTGWELTGVSYSYNYNYTLNPYATAPNDATITGGGLALSWSGSGNNIQATYSSSTNSLVFELYTKYDSFFRTSGAGSFTINSVTATFNYRRIVANTTTPSNLYILNSNSYALSTAQVLAEGSLNWVAMGD